jgi:hypothetical protein
VLVVATVLGVIVTIAAGAGQGQPPTGSAAAYVRSTGRDAARVEAAATGMRLALGRAAGSMSTGDLGRLARAATTAEVSLTVARREFATTAVTGTVGDAEVEVFTAVSDLAKAVGSIVTYTAAPTPGALGLAASQYGSAVGEWNDGVRVIWRAAGRPGATPAIS